jgi:hypothetical protein
MLRVTYEFHCDYCGEQDGVETLTISTGHVMPQVGIQRAVFNNVALCTTCTGIAVKAMNEALKDRLLQPEA